ncbi:hypothetical protein MNV49_006222 [Pseudohyphozyma bogoriensis]|nr:hypothetical protein MNV49_006222 [Pseudohyphozyma bogoriensis]
MANYAASLAGPDHDDPTQPTWASTLTQRVRGLQSSIDKLGALERTNFSMLVEVKARLVAEERMGINRFSYEDAVDKREDDCKLVPIPNIRGQWNPDMMEPLRSAEQIFELSREDCLTYIEFYGIQLEPEYLQAATQIGLARRLLKFMTGVSEAATSVGGD